MRTVILSQVNIHTEYSSDIYDEIFKTSDITVVHSKHSSKFYSMCKRMSTHNSVHCEIHQEKLCIGKKNGKRKKTIAMWAKRPKMC